jgi:hypothetical protein
MSRLFAVLFAASESIRRHLETSFACPWNFSPAPVANLQKQGA